MKLRKHQQRFLDENPDKAMLCWAMRTGKSLPASIWLSRRDKNAYVVCPKQLVKDWEKLTPFATVWSKETFKKRYKEIKNPSGIVIDESHTFASNLFMGKRSQLASSLYLFVKENPKMPILLLSATMIRNDPSSLHTQLCYIGKYIDWNKWRNHFYSLEKRPYLPRPAWLPKKGWQIEARKVLEKHADIVALSDCVDYLPPVTDEVVKIKNKPEKGEHWAEEHQSEQQGKSKFIKSLGYQKIIVVAHYTAQIDDLAKKLGSEREVFILDGRTKDPTTIIKAAQNSPECYFIVQASMGVGFDGYMFDCLVFASMSHKALDHTQMKGRLTNLEQPKPQMFYYLISSANKWDKRIYDSVMMNKNFNPHIYRDDLTTATTTT